MKKNHLLIVVLSIGALALGLWLNYSLSSRNAPQEEHAIEGLLWPQTKSLTDFALIDQHEQPFTLNNLKGRWSLVFFGYTHCPDVCPTTMVVLKGVKQQLVAHAEETANTQYIFVSVDGHRDTASVLANYMNYFDPAFIGVNGADEQIKALTGQLGVVYMKVAESNPDNYLVDHSASILLFDPLGRMIALFSAPHTVEGITARYLAIRQFLNKEYP